MNILKQSFLYLGKSSCSFNNKILLQTFFHKKVMDVYAASIQEPFRTLDFSDEGLSMEFNWSVRNVPPERLPQGTVDFASNAQK